jgi:transposase
MMGSVTRAVNHLTLEEVKMQIKEAKDPRQLQRWHIIHTALLHPRTAEAIATCVGVSKSLVAKTIAHYNKGGIQAIQVKRVGGRYRSYLRSEEEERFLEPLYQKAEQGAFITAEDIKKAYEQQIGRIVHTTTISRLLQRHGWRKIVPRRKHPKAETDVQEAFKKTLPERIQKAEQGKKLGDTRETAFLVQDEARFTRITHPTRCWAPQRMRPCVPHQVVREAFYVFAAIEPKTGQMRSVILPTADTEMMNIFLTQVSEDSATSFVVIQVDGAGWHHSRDLTIPENIRLIFQPPYSPEVNPVEHLWEEIREKHMANQMFSSLDDLQNHLCTVLSEFSSRPDDLRALTYFPYIRTACEIAT